MKITCSSARLRVKFDVLGENHDKKVMDTKKIISQSQQHAIEKKVIVKNILELCKAAQHVCTSACYKEKENAQNDLNQVNSNLHAGFVIIFDNIDGKLNKRHMTKDNQNYDYHWINYKVAITEYLETNLIHLQEMFLMYQTLNSFQLYKTKVDSVITILCWLQGCLWNT